MLVGMHAHQHPDLHQDSESVAPSTATISRTASTHVHNFSHTIFLHCRRDSDHARLLDCTIACTLIVKYPEPLPIPPTAPIHFLQRLELGGPHVEAFGRRDGEAVAVSADSLQTLLKAYMSVRPEARTRSVKDTKDAGEGYTALGCPSCVTCPRRQGLERNVVGL